MALLLTKELRAWLRPGLVGFIATVGDHGRLEMSRLWAVRPHDETRDLLEAYVIRSGSLALLSSIANGARAAVNLIEVPSYSSRMFKGPCTVSTQKPDQNFVNTCIGAADVALQSVGMPSGSLSAILSHYDSHEVVSLLVEVESVFDQSPKPGAGARL